MRTLNLQQTPRTPLSLLQAALVQGRAVYHVLTLLCRCSSPYVRDIRSSVQRSHTVRRGGGCGDGREETKREKRRINARARARAHTHTHTYTRVKRQHVIKTRTHTHTHTDTHTHTGSSGRRSQDHQHAVLVAISGPFLVATVVLHVPIRLCGDVEAGSSAGQARS